MSWPTCLGVEGARAQERRPPDTGRDDDRVGALRAYRRARGLCFKCGERYSPGHQCATTIQLHFVEELLELLQADTAAGEPTADYADSDEESLMSISEVAMSGATSATTMRLVGSLRIRRC